MIFMALEGLYLICCMLCIISVGEWTYHWTVKNPKKIALAGVIYFVGFFLYFVLKLPYKMLFYVFELWAYLLLSKYRFKDKIFKIVALYFIVGIPEAITTLVIDVAGGYWIWEESKKILGIVIAYLLFYIITKQKWYKKLIGYLDSISGMKSILVFSVVVFGLLMVVCGNSVRDMIDSRNLEMLFRIVLVIELCAVLGIVLWLIIESNQKQYYLEQNYLKEEYIRTQQEYYRTIYEKDKEMRGFRHDVANQLGLLRMLLEREDWNGAKEHLNSIDQNFSQASFYKIHVGEDMLDAILSMMSQKASETGIQIEIAGRLEDGDIPDVYALCAIFSNAINNALEACDKVGGEKKICVKIVSHNRTLCCRFENPATEEMYQAILGGMTTKADADNHGYGIKNIRNAVERLNGSMEYIYTDGKLVLEIYI